MRLTKRFGSPKLTRVERRIGTNSCWFSMIAKNNPALCWRQCQKKRENKTGSLLLRQSRQKGCISNLKRYNWKSKVIQGHLKSSNVVWHISIFWRIDDMINVQISIYKPKEYSLSTKHKSIPNRFLDIPFFPSVYPIFSIQLNIGFHISYSYIETGSCEKQ